MFSRFVVFDLRRFPLYFISSEVVASTAVTFQVFVFISNISNSFEVTVSSVLSSTVMLSCFCFPFL
jgi:hypothetical protein